jgi:hypothetical protein
MLDAMSQPPTMRRADKQMDPQRATAVLSAAYCGRLATVSGDGGPYICPLLFVWHDGRIWFHTTAARGHLASNIAHDARACFEVDEPGGTFAYGRFLCDTGLAYRSVLVFGRIEVVTACDDKARFFDRFMARYHPEPGGARPTGFYPRLDEVTVYAMSADRITGKETTLPAVEARWPAVDRTRSPHAVNPGG